MSELVSQSLADAVPATESSESIKTAEDTENGNDKGPEVSVATEAEDDKKSQPVAPAQLASDDGVGEVADQFDQFVNIGKQPDLHEIQAVPSHLSAGILFSDPKLKIPAPILESLTHDMRFDKPSAIQASTIPLILDGRNVIAQAQAGSGKTVAFTIGILSRIDTNKSCLQALCLTPTRELANQIVSDAVARLSSRMPGVRWETAVPGVEVERGARCLSHIVVGTPGTVKKWVGYRYLDLSTVRIFVLDEADAMVAKSQQAKTLGADTLAIKKWLPPTAQILFFSATYTKDIMAFSERIVHRAYLVTLSSDEDLILDVVLQVCITVNTPDDKLRTLQDIYEFMSIKQSIVFVETKADVDRIAAMMNANHLKVSKLHGELPPEERDRAMSDFRSGVSKVLLTTNVLARGVDVPSVAVVVNYDIPREQVGMTRQLVGDCATYVHRIGRCSRFGRKGMVINFLQSPQDKESMHYIESYYSPKKRMTVDWHASDIEGLTHYFESRGHAAASAASASASATAADK